MSDYAWTAATDTVEMFPHIRRERRSVRQNMLIGAALASRLAQLDPDENSFLNRAIRTAEQHAEGQDVSAEWAAFGPRQGMVTASYPQLVLWNLRSEDLTRVSDLVARGIADLAVPKQERRNWVERRFRDAYTPSGIHVFEKAYTEEIAVHCLLLRCVFANPFRPVAADPAWRTPTVLALADAIYAERAFDRLPILADALEESSCDHADVLSHCRGPGPHVRGCWVVDLLLRKS